MNRKTIWFSRKNKHETQNIWSGIQESTPEQRLAQRTQNSQAQIHDIQTNLGEQCLYRGKTISDWRLRTSNPRNPQADILQYGALSPSSLADTCEPLHIFPAYALQARIQLKAAVPRKNNMRTFFETMLANCSFSNVPASVRWRLFSNPLRTPKNFPEVLRSGLVLKLPLLTCLIHDS